jgi:SAM-dependent MidA family methyltransferase
LSFEQESGNEDLRRFILSLIREEGPVSFAQFMECCLYHPAYGYYASGEAGIGREGDYYTSPCVHPLFGGMVARQLSQMSGILGGETFSVLEAGGGRGILCEDILTWVEKNDPAFYERITYYLLETSPRFLEEQRTRLSGRVEHGKVAWITEEDVRAGWLLPEGCILSNELVDALPVHRVVRQNGGLKEIFVGEEEGRFVEILGSPADSRIDGYFAEAGVSLEEGQKAEANLRALEWLEDAGRCMSRGFFLTVDYGYPASELYDPSRKEGTLRCYFRHQVSDSFYERVGRQDITSHVNFTSLIRRGEELGIHFTGLVPQYRFLIALGLLDEAAEAAKGMSPVDGLALRLSLKHLIEPERGMGEVFKVLIQHKGIEKPELRGLQDLRALSPSGQGR